MAFSNKFSFTIIFLIICLTLHDNPLKSAGVTVDLIPRDASKSYFDRLDIAIERSSQRLNYFSSVFPNNNLGGSKIQTHLIPSGGSYLMNISIGTPPVTLHGIVDTTSGFTWTQCLPCISCYKQELPIYDSGKSSTYKALPCNSYACDIKYFDRSFCDYDTSNCIFVYVNNGGGTTNGEFATETFRIGDQKSGNFESVAFGCSRYNEGTFDPSSSGLIGLGPEPLSLVSQHHEKKFSYCLQPLSSSAPSKISFGSDADVTGVGVVRIPFPHIDIEYRTLYYLTMEGITVGGKRINIEKPDNLVESNVFIDTSMTFTYVPSALYSNVTSAVEKAISVKKVDRKNKWGLTPCYNASDKIDVPDFTVHFKGGDVKLSWENLFVQVDEQTVCFTFLDGGDYLLITYGSIIQTNFLVGYDLDAGTVSFLPKDCTKA